MFSWLKTKDNCLMQIVCLGGLFAWGSICRVSSLCKACFWSLGRVPDAPPKSKVCCPFCVTSPWEGLTKIYLHLSSGNCLMVVYTLETFVSMYPIPMLGHIRYFYSPCITLDLTWCVNRFQGLISLMCFTCSFWKKAIHIIKPFVLYDWGFSSTKSWHTST